MLAIEKYAVDIRYSENYRFSIIEEDI